MDLDLKKHDEDIFNFGSYDSETLKRILPSSHAEGFRNGEMPKYVQLKDIATSYFSNPERFGPGLQVAWNSMTWPNPAGEQFQRAYEDYVADPSSLLRSSQPEKYEFLKRYVFHGREYLHLENRSRDLPPQHLEGPRYRSEHTYENAARDVFDDPDLFNEALHKHWNSLAAAMEQTMERNLTPEQAFSVAYEGYLKAPKILSRDMPQLYAFLREHVFYEASSQDLKAAEKLKLAAGETERDRLVSTVLGGEPATRPTDIHNEEQLRNWLLDNTREGADVPSVGGHGARQEALSEYWKMMLRDDTKLNERYQRAREQSHKRSLRARSDKTWREAQDALGQKDIPGARHSLLESWEAVNELKDRPAMADRARILGEIYESLGQRDTARDWRRESVQHYEALAQESYRRARENGMKGSWDSARDLYNKAGELHQKLGDELGMADDLYALAEIAYTQGDESEGRKLMRKSGDTRVMFVNPSHEPGKDPDLELLRSPQRLEQFQKIRDTFNKLGDESHEAFGLHGLGIENLKEGRLDEAAELFEQSLQINEKLGDEWGSVDNQLWLGICAFYKGQLDEARGLFGSIEQPMRRTFEYSRKVGDHKGMTDSTLRIADSMLWLANVAFEDGDADSGVHPECRTTPLVNFSKRLDVELHPDQGGVVEEKAHQRVQARVLSAGGYRREAPRPDLPRTQPLRERTPQMAQGDIR